MPVTKANGININYTITGHGEPLLMIMGLSADQRGWAPQIGFFKKYFKVITFDNRGAGRSDKPAGPYTIKMMADDTIGLMDCLNIEKAHVMGLSMGGMIAQEIAINYPLRVNRLILASTYSCNDNSLNGATEEMASAIQQPYSQWLVSLVNLAFGKPSNKFIFSLQIRISSLFISSSIKALNQAGVMGQTEACIKHDTIERLSSIQSPTLVITGTKDRVIKPSSSETLATKIPHARLFKIENGSHTCNSEMKNIFNPEVLKFLQSN